MPPPTTPRSASPAEDQPSRVAALLSHWGFSRAGLLDNRRGEWWLIAQLVLLTTLLAPPLPPLAWVGLSWPWPWRAGGAVLVLLGAVEALLALRQLGTSLTPLPEPLPEGALVTSGPYARSRHPLYRAILLGALGLALLLGSLLHLLVGLALAGLLGGKARREERSLLRLHPAYADYQRQTAAILPRLPWLDWRA
jgi:protein-S-isoprenylcysteine O-methyltransferase Ste14